MAEKTNAIRILEKKKIQFDVIAYNVDPEDLSATHVADSLGEPFDHVYKTLVLRGDKTGVFVCQIPAHKEIDLKKAAKISGNKKAEMILMKELLPLTGYIRGGCTPIGMKKDYPVFISQNMAELSEVYISAGKRGLQIKLKPEDLKEVTRATFCDLTKEDSN